MNSKEDGPKFTNRYSFLSIYKPKQTLNDPTFHYFTQPQPGYQRVSLYSKQSRKPYSMYYEKVDNEEMQHLKKIKQGKTDNSSIIDLQYFSSRNNTTIQETVIDRSKITRDSEWVKKYEPHKFIDLLTDEKINRNLLTWVKAWDPIVFNKPLVKKTNMASALFNRTLGSAPNKLHNTGQSNYTQAIFQNPKKLILLAGPPGCGKTTLMRVLANHCKYEIVQINASDDRSAQNLIGKLQDITSNDTIRGNKKPPLICLDQIDGVAESQSSGITKILEFIENGSKNKQKKSSNTNLEPKQSKKQYPNKTEKDAGPTKFQRRNAVTSHNTELNRPVIFICNDPFAKSLKQLRSRAHVVYFSQLAADRIIKRMRQILEKEKVHVEQQVLQKICEICRNDVRSCIGVLQLVVGEKRINNKNPKDIVNRMRLSFAKDNQSSINEFLLELFAHKLEIGEHSGSIGKYIEHKVMQIGNASLLMETFLNNFISLHILARKNKQMSQLYDDLIKADVLIGNGFKHNNQLDRFQMLPYFRFMLKFGSEEVNRIQFPSLFFERLRKLKCNKQILKSIYEKIPKQIKIFMRKQSMIGSYLLSLYYSMQTMSVKQSQIVKCVSIMLTYGFNFRKQKQVNQNNPIFHPEIDVLLTYGNRKPLILMSGATKISMEQNYDYFKDKRQMLVDNELRDNTIAMVNQMNLHSRKKGRNEEQVIKYKFAEGTGTKTSYCLSVGYFF